MNTIISGIVGTTFRTADARQLKCAGIVAFLALSMPAMAGNAVHIVQPGDNLYNLARAYLEDAGQWRELQSLNQIRDPSRLAPGTRLVIPGNLMRPQPATAQVLHVAGAASVDHTPAQVGQQVAEGSRIAVAEGGFVTLRLADGTLVRLPSRTTVQLRELRHSPSTGNVRSILELERGRVDAQVTPLPSPKSRFEVRTPLAVGGVRGTTFGVALADNGDFIGDVREGAVQVQRLTPTPALSSSYALVRAGEGTRLGGNPTSSIRTRPLLEAPDLSALPDVVEDISLIELPLPAPPHATTWQVRIASDAALEHVERNGVFTQPLARFAGLEDGTYRLAVRVGDEDGVPGGEAIRTFTVNARPQAPLLREPRQGGRVYGPSVKLLCTDSSSAVGYSFQLARDARFTDIVAQSSADATRCAHTFPDVPPGDYHWRVAAVARDAAGLRDLGPYSRPIGFTVAAVPPAPAGSSIRTDDSGNLVIQWGASPGGPWQQQVQVAADRTFTQLLDDQLLAESVYRRATPPAGTYYLRVRQIDAHGMQGPWSPTQTLEVAGRILTSDDQPVTNSDGLRVQPGER